MANRHGDFIWYELLTSDPTAAERASSAKFEDLRLSRSRIMGQLATATNPAHRTMLERALKSLEPDAPGTNGRD